MKKNKLTNISSEQLTAKKKTMTNVAIGLGIVMLIVCSTLFYFAFTHKNFALIPIAIGSLLTIYPCLINLNQINAELKSRESDYIK